MISLTTPHHRDTWRTIQCIAVIREDWQRYHTRYITPQRFHEALQRP